MISHTFNHPEYINYFSDRVKKIQEEYDFDNIVLNFFGSGVTMLGVLKGFMDYDNFLPPKVLPLI